MKFDTIKWCLKQKKGIILVEPNKLVSEDYVKESLSDFDMFEKSNPKWKIITAYYACYDAVYAILVKIGIKCEIHDCTIALMELIGFNKGEIKFLENIKDERINVQYYLESPGLSINRNKILEFLNKCKEIIKDMNDDKINEIRRRLKDIGGKK